VKVIADREIRVATLSGACVLFQPNVEREVSDEIGLLALQQGARQSGTTKLIQETVTQTDEIDFEVPEDPKLNEDVIEAIEKFVESANPDDFKADGTPKASALNRVVGRTVSTDEREAAWEEFIKS
jgi:hypothetical protein